MSSGSSLSSISTDSISSNTLSTSMSSEYEEPRRTANRTFRGFYHKQRYYSQRQDRCNNRNKKQPTTYSPEAQQSLLNTLMEKFMSRLEFVEIKEIAASILMGGDWDTLNKQIWDAFISCQQTEETYKKKLTLWQYLYTFIRSGFPRYGLFLVGSTMSGFGSNSSDIDMCLLVRPSYVDQRSEAVNYLEEIQHSLKQCSNCTLQPPEISLLCFTDHAVAFVSTVHFVDNVELIWAKVPILKFRDSCRNLEVDLNCNNVVVLIVKLWANANNINDAKNMTISSYSLALMVIHYLQCRYRIITLFYTDDICNVMKETQAYSMNCICILMSDDLKSTTIY